MIYLWTIIYGVIIEKRLNNFILSNDLKTKKSCPPAKNWKFPKFKNRTLEFISATPLTLLIQNILNFA